jgi:hypothetical protein
MNTIEKKMTERHQQIVGEYLNVQPPDVVGFFRARWRLINLQGIVTPDLGISYIRLHKSTQPNEFLPLQNSFLLCAIHYAVLPGKDAANEIRKALNECTVSFISSNWIQLEPLPVGHPDGIHLKDPFVIVGSRNNYFRVDYNREFYKSDIPADCIVSIGMEGFMLQNSTII